MMLSRFFGFTEHPFHLTSDPRFLFMTDRHEEALGSMMYGITERKGFVAITGEVGTGKTTLIRHLLKTLDPKIKPVFVYQTLMSFEELLREIALELELPPGDQSKTGLIRQINDFLIQRLARDEIVVVIIDEAQNLSNEVLEGLRLLSNLETERTKLLQIVLVGQPEFEAKLNVEALRQLKQRIGIWRHIRPLTPQESVRYLEHRLSKVGGSLGKVFTKDAVSLICEAARGIPRVINMMCDNAFLIAYALGKKQVDEKILWEVVADMGLLRDKEPDCREAKKVLAAGAISPATTVTQPERTRDERIGSTGGSREPEGWSGNNGERAPFLEKHRESGNHRNVAFVAVGVLALMVGGFLSKNYWPDSGTTSASIAPPSSLSRQEDAPPKKEAAFKDNAGVREAWGRLQEEREKGRTISAERGETLSSLLLKHYGFINETLLDFVLTSNPAITNPNLILEEQTIRLPEITEESLVVASEDGSYGIWIGTFRNRREADALRQKASVHGKEMEMRLRHCFPGETWHRAQVGGFQTREECLASIRELKGRGVLAALEK